MDKLSKSFLILTLMASLSQVADAGSPEPISSTVTSKSYEKQCQQVKKYIIQRRYAVECHKNYHHYNANSARLNYKESSESKVKVAGFNILHPGNARSTFKDFSIIARLINEYDVLSASELLPIIGRDLVNNKNVFKYMQVHGDSRNIRKILRAPGYIKILDELRKLDKSWALMLSATGEAAKIANVHELIGFFYRGSKVKPISNEHCAEYFPEKSVTAYACYPDITEAFLEKNSENVFSRRPFITSFKSGKFDFTLMTSHVVFNSSDNEEDMKKILQPTFDVDHYTQILGIGFTQVNYARFAEAKVILELIENLGFFYKEKDIIYIGDMNLEKKNRFWFTMFRNHPSLSLLGDKLTTLSKRKVDSNGRDSNGLSSNYDHFILNHKQTNNECADEKGNIVVDTHNFLKGNIQNIIEKKYLIRKGNSLSRSSGKYDFPMRVGALDKMEKETKKFEQRLSKIKTIIRGQIVFDDHRIQKRIEKFKRRIFFNQLNNDTYYKLFQEIVSDHLPLSITCKTQIDDD